MLALQINLKTNLLFLDTLREELFWINKNESIAPPRISQTSISVLLIRTGVSRTKTSYDGPLHYGAELFLTAHMTLMANTGQITSQARHSKHKLGFVILIISFEIFPPRFS